MYKRVVVAYDGSENARRVVEEAIRLAHLLEEMVIDLVYVIDEEELGSVAFRSDESLKNDPIVLEHLRPVEEMLDEDGVTYEVTKLRGTPAKVILAYAEQSHADLIIVGSRGLNPVSKLVLGSVSQKIVNESHIPVLVLK